MQWAPHQPVSESSATWVKQLTGVLCKPTYRIDSYSVSYTNVQDTLRMQAVKKPGTNSTLRAFDDSMLIQAVRASFKNTTFGEGGADYVVTQVPSIFQVMKAMSNVSSLQPFMDPNLLQDLGSRIFQGASAQIARTNLMTSQDSSVSGSLIVTEDRLQVKRLTVGLMATCLGLLVCVSILEVIFRPWNTISCEPKSIGALSTILAASSRLRQRLVGTGSASLDALHHQLSRDRFHTAIVQQETTSFVLDVVPVPAEMPGSPPSSSLDDNTEWWRPIPVRRWFITLIIVLPLGFIVLLEVLQHVSDSRNGFVDVTNSNVDSQILSTYLPAFVALALAILYTSLDFAVSIFTPLIALRRGNVPATQSIMVGSIGGLPLLALVQSLRGRCFTRCMTIIAAFVSGLLAIVVSALYTVEIVPTYQPVTLQRADFFNWSHVDLSQDDGFAGSVTNLIAHENTPYPQWTYDNLVLPSLTASSAKISALLNESESIVVRVPAIRGSLSNCSAVPPRFVNITARGAPPNCANCNDLVQLDYLMTLPYSLCGLNSTNPTNATWRQTYLAPNDSSTVYAGTGTSLQWYLPSSQGGLIMGDGGVILDNPHDSVKSDYSVDNIMPSCPSLSYSLGTANAGTKIGKPAVNGGVTWNSKQNITIVYCYQRLEQVMTDVTFSYPDFTINTNSPPNPLEESAIVITQNNTQHWFDISLNTFINSLQDLPISIKGRNSINGFIQALSMGYNSVPLNQLYSNGDLSNLNAAANRLYGQYIAQAISANMRTTVLSSNTNTIYNTDNKPTTYTATLRQPTQRLYQSRGPKIALQSMLAGLAVCAIATYAVVDTKRVVPHNSCSIAGMMSLLAESEMCRTREVIPEEAEWKTVREWKRDGVFGGRVFWMRWWGEDGDTLGEGEKGRIFGIDVA